MLKADLHVHTEYSLDCNTPLKEVITRCQERSIDCLAISDHGTIEGALKMQEMAPPFRLIVAEEILTRRGEIMGVFLEEGIPSGLSVSETVARIRAQNALILIPHPFDPFRPSALETEALEELQAQGEIDAIEVFNARTLLYRTSAKAKAFARKHGLPGSAGSDAHTPYEIGNAYVEMPEFSGRDDFLAALAQGKIFGHRTNPLTHFNSILARLKNSLG
ncbi:MAG: PHP domain-containing protein [Dehalococcoidales bacterium]|nr:PHP domain-containing protein [Dehalococcoidales bacterium]